MRTKQKRIFTLFLAGMLLLLCGCGRVTQESPPLGEDEGEIAIAASFRQEDGIALDGGTIQLAFGENSINHPLGNDGELIIPGLPRVGDLMLTVFDQHEHIQGAMPLSLSKGAVIDATTDGSGVGHITLKEDTDEVALIFILRDDGSLLCALRLTESDPLHFDFSQEID